MALCAAATPVRMTPDEKRLVREMHFDRLVRDFWPPAVSGSLSGFPASASAFRGLTGAFSIRGWRRWDAPFLMQIHDQNNDFEALAVHGASGRLSGLGRSG